jgi:hypothetical protein
MEFDARLTNLGIGVTATPNAVWKCAAAKYQDETQAGGNHHIYFTVQDALGKPAAGVACVVDWVGRELGDQPTRVVTDANGQANVPLYANLDITLKNGPYFAFVEDRGKSDVVTGMGLPEKHHVNFLLTFGPVVAAPAQQPEEAAIAAAKQRVWMPINSDGALYKFAQAKNLGYPQTDEFEFTYSNVAYVGQVYNLGIVYVKQGDWGNCQWVKKPGQ